MPARPCRRPSASPLAAPLRVALAAALAALAGCRGGAAAPRDHHLNHHLTYESRLEAGEAVGPHHTAVLDLAARQPLLGACASEAPVHEVPYRITDGGEYQFCIPAGDARLTEVELLDADGKSVGTWTQGQACTPVALAPALYTLHVHVAAGAAEEEDPLVFLAPGEVTVTPAVSSPALRSAAWNGPVPADQILNLRAASLDELLDANARQGLRQGWLVRTPWNDAGAPVYPVLSALNTWSYPSQPMLGRTVNPGDWLAEDSLLYFQRAPASRGVILTQGPDATPIVESGSTCYLADFDPMADPDVQYTCRDHASVLVPERWGTPAVLQFVSAGPRAFRLGGYQRYVGWVDTSASSGWGWAFGPGLDDDPVLTPVTLSVVARFGTTPGAVPAIMDDEVALFDQAIAGGRFPPDTRYWIFDASLPDFGRLGVLNPSDQVRTVIAGRKVRAHAFRYPSFQGDDFYVSPPVDGELAVTSTDLSQLDEQAVESLQLEPNTGDITASEYRRQVIVGTNTCIGCDLRGFNLRSREILQGANLARSDLSYADLRLLHAGIMSTDLSGANLSHADLRGDLIDSCVLDRTDFSWANLEQSSFATRGGKGGPDYSFLRRCPKFEHVDLTKLDEWSHVYEGFDTYFEGANVQFDPGGWWAQQRLVCRTSIAYSKVNRSLFHDPHLWQFLDAHGVDFSGQDLSGLSLLGVNLRGANFAGAKLQGTVLAQADLTGAILTGADLTGANLSGAVLGGVNLRDNVVLRNVILSGLTFTAPDWSNLSLNGAKLSGATFKNWDGYSVDFSPTSLNGAYLYNTDFGGADLSGAFLQGVSWWGPRATGEHAIMVGTQLEKADLPGLNLKQAHLAGANFTDAVMINADLSTTTGLDHGFRGTVFNTANLKGANLSGANLAGASLFNAFVSFGPPTPASQTATIEILDDPARNPGYYAYFQIAYGGTIGPASTVGVTSCPDDTAPPDGCGPLDADHPAWVSPAPPHDPKDCETRRARPGEKGDDQGNVIVCKSTRH